MSAAGGGAGPAGPAPAGGSAGPAGPAPAGPVAPGTGWPGDPATPATPVAHDAAGVRALAAGAGSMAELVARQSVCRACPRLVEWREHVAVVKRRAHASEQYWGRPVPGWGAERARVLILGLAPAAHGGNRTGRIFTGDRSGDVLFASLYRCGLASQPTSVSAADGLQLAGTRIAAAVRCAPPLNKPTPAERDTCAPWLSAEFALALPELAVVVCLGGFAWQALWQLLRTAGFSGTRPRPAFGHGAAALAGFPDGERAGQQLLVLGCYHPSQQNTFTGRVTPAMLDDVFARAARQAGLASAAGAADSPSAS